jgi:hypothetical protein
VYLPGESIDQGTHVAFWVHGLCDQPQRIPRSHHPYPSVDELGTTGRTGGSEGTTTDASQGRLYAERKPHHEEDQHRHREKAPSPQYGRTGPARPDIEVPEERTPRRRGVFRRVSNPRNVGEQSYHGNVTPVMARTGVPSHLTTNARSLSIGFYEQMFAVVTLSGYTEIAPGTARSIRRR